MYVITNRRYDVDDRGRVTLGDVPSEKGPNELRVVKAERIDRYDWVLREVPDALSDQEARALPTITPAEVAWLDEQQRRPEDQRRRLPGSRLVADRVHRSEKHAVLYVHGYNNRVVDSLERAHEIQELYGVQVVVFSWPSNGGGLRGTASYLSDKADARASFTALLRTLVIAARYMSELRADAIERIHRRLAEPVAGDADGRERRLAELIERDCGKRLTLLAHSMGNYLLEQAFDEDPEELPPLLFDNIVLASADVNRAGHRRWVDRIDFRNRLFVCINEDDFALGVSRLKGGELQRARLGHETRGLDALRASYIDFTAARHVGSAHTYFAGDPVKNEEIREFFRQAFTGGRPEGGLPYNADRNLYRVAGTDTGR